MQDLRELTRTLLRLGAAFGESLTEDDVAAFVSALHGFDTRAVELAVDTLIESADFRPGPAELRVACAEAEPRLLLTRCAESLASGAAGAACPAPSRPRERFQAALASLEDARERAAREGVDLDARARPHNDPFRVGQALREVKEAERAFENAAPEEQAVALDYLTESLERATEAVLLAVAARIGERVTLRRATRDRVACPKRPTPVQVHRVVPRPRARGRRRRASVASRGSPTSEPDPDVEPSDERPLAAVLLDQARRLR